MKYALVKIIEDKTAPLWSELAADFIANARTYKSPITVRCADSPSIAAFGKHIGNPRIDQVTPADCDRFVDYLRLRMSPSSARTRLVTVRSIFQYAVTRGQLQQNPFAGVRIPKQKAAGRVLSDDEIKRLLMFLKDAPARAVKLALYTGMRRQEICSLDWSQVGDDYLVIPIEKSKSRRERTILLQKKALEVLGPRRDSGSVFGLRQDHLNRAMTIAWCAADLGRVRFHDLRHTAATRFMEASDDIFAMMDAFGWISEASARPYQHITRARQQRMFGIKYSF